MFGNSSRGFRQWVLLGCISRATKSRPCAQGLGLVFIAISTRFVWDIGSGETFDFAFADGKLPGSLGATGGTCELVGPLEVVR